MVDYTGIPYLLQPEPNYAAAGQPTVEQVKNAARTGLRRIINLRPSAEGPGYDESSLAQALGLEYYCIPIAGPQDLNADTVQQLHDLLVANADVHTLVHCATANRVGALIALRAAWLHDEPVDIAISAGQRWGLTKLEPVVRRLLGTV